MPRNENAPKVARWQLALAISVPVLMFAAYLWLGSARPAMRQLKMTVIDVGQGDSLLLETPSGHSVLIDGGGHSDSIHPESASDVGEKVVVPYLRHEGLNRVDLMVITHPHGDHVGGLSAVVRDLAVGRILDGTVLPCDTEAYRSLIGEAASRAIPRDRAVRGMRIDLGDCVTMDVLNPPASGTPYGEEPDNDTVNNYSTVLRVTYGKTHLMLDGDAQTEAEDSMMAAYPNALRADVIKCGHHGAHNATSTEWLEAVRPKVAIISCGLRNHYGHPAPITLARLASAGVKTYVTARDGAVTVISDGTTVSVTTEREGNGGK